MRAEQDVPIEERYLMVLGKLSPEMIRQIEEEQMPSWMERMRPRVDASVLREWERFAQRDRTRDQAFYTLYAYADIPLGRRYNCVLRRRHGGTPLYTDCTVEYVLYEGWFPIPQLEDGHKHIVFLRFNGSVPDCIPAFERWEDIVQTDWQVGLCDQDTYEARQAVGEPRHATDG